MAGRCGCSGNCSCAAASSSSVEVAGTGTAANPWVPEVVYSTDPGNLARPGTDGAVFADVCLLSGLGIPVEPDEDGCLPLPPPVILDYAGDPIPPEPDGSIQLPPGSGAPAFGCGLDVDGGGDLIVATTATWPVDDLAGNALTGPATGGAPLFCDGTGAVRAVPEHTTVAADSGDLGLIAAPPELVAQGTTWTGPATTDLTVANPSAARTLRGRWTITAGGTVWLPSAWSVLVVVEASPDGGGSWGEVGRWAATRVVADGADTPVAMDDGGYTVQQAQIVVSGPVVDVAAGASVTARVRGKVIVGADPLPPSPPPVQVRSLVARIAWTGATV